MKKFFLVTVATLLALCMCTGCGEIPVSDDTVMYRLDNGETVVRRESPPFYEYSYSGTPETPPWECPWSELIGVIPKKYWIFYDPVEEYLCYRWDTYNGDEPPFIEEIVWVVTPAWLQRAKEVCITLWLSAILLFLLQNFNNLQTIL